MSITNGYATLDEFLALPEFESSKPTDDVFIERLIERCSREFDGDTGQWFYSEQATRYYDTPRGRCLELDAPLLGVTTVTNGDNTNVAATEYKLYPLNGINKSEIRLKQSSSTAWQTDGSGDSEGVITVRGEWGYVDRSSTDPESMAAILNSKTAVLALALAVYKRRYGVGTDGVATVTGAGVVITPRDKSPEYLSIVQRYRRLL